MGKLYPQGTIIKIRPLNVQEIKYLATISEENATDIINEILEKCLILKGIEFCRLKIKTTGRQYCIKSILT